MTVNDAIAFVNSCGEADVRAIGTIVNRRIAAFNKEKKATKGLATVKTDEWSLRLAEAIWKNVKEVYPLAKNPEIGIWAVEIRRIVDIDKIPEPVVELVLAHALQDKFWRNQVRSGAALRRHFEKIYMNGKANFDAQAAKKQKVYKV